MTKNVKILLGILVGVIAVGAVFLMGNSSSFQGLMRRRPSVPFSAINTTIDKKTFDVVNNNRIIKSKPSFDIALNNIWTVEDPNVSPKFYNPYLSFWYRISGNIDTDNMTVTLKTLVTPNGANPPYGISPIYYAIDKQIKKDDLKNGIQGFYNIPKNKVCPTGGAATYDFSIDPNNKIEETDETNNSNKINVNCVMYAPMDQYSLSYYLSQSFKIDCGTQNSLFCMKKLGIMPSINDGQIINKALASQAFYKSYEYSKYISKGLTPPGLTDFNNCPNNPGVDIYADVKNVKDKDGTTIVSNTTKYIVALANLNVLESLGCKGFSFNPTDPFTADLYNFWFGRIPN